MSFFTFASILLFLVYLQLGLFVFFKNKTGRLNRLFLGLALCFSVWSFAYIFVYSAHTAQGASYWDKIASIGYALFPALMMAFKMELCKCLKGNKWGTALIWIMVLTGLFLSYANLTGAWRSAEITEGKYAWHFSHEFSFYYLLYYFYLLAASILSFYFLLKWRFRINQKGDIAQFHLYFFTLLSFFGIGIITDIVLPLLEITIIPNIGHIASLPWLLAIAFAIGKYQIMASNVNYLLADNVVKQIKEIIIFTDLNYQILRSNTFTEKLLGKEYKSLKGLSVLDFFENHAIIRAYLKRSGEKEYVGPISATMLDNQGSQIEANLYIMPIKDFFDDMQGYIIYGHDHREALNLQKEIIVKQHAEENLRAISEVLETRVKERTQELTESYKELQVKMTERMRVEEQIKSDIAEKEVLINEIHDRVKNNMNIIISLIRVYDKQNLSSAASKKFKELAQRVNSLLLVHQNLYLSISYSDVDFANFIKTIAPELQEFHRKTQKVELRYEVSEVFLDVDYAIPLGIVINELISNAFMHAFSDYYLKRNDDKKHVIHIKYAYENGYYEISVSDNGKGLPKNFDIDELATNGLPLTDILVKDQINGNMEVHSSEEGSSFIIAFFASK